MAYFAVEDFAAGIDLRKNVVTAKAGSLRVLKNGIVNAGGEIEKRKKFALVGQAPNSYGLGSLDNQPYVFRIPGQSGANPALFGTKLIAPSAFASGVYIQQVLDVEVFGSKLYVILLLSDGTVRHLYDGVEVTPNVFGRFAKTHKTKMYTGKGAAAGFSCVNEPNVWANGVGPPAHVGAGTIDVTQQDTGNPDLIGMEPYFTNLAVFGSRSIQIWTMDPDPAKNQFVSSLAGVGLIGPRAAARYGTGDVLFASHSGIRSLKARDMSNAASVSDIGSPIDNLIQDARLTLDSATATKIQAIVDPITGAWWLCWGETIYVLSYYPATKVTAWSTYEPGFPIDYAAVCGSRMILRSGDDIYIHGSIPTIDFDFYAAGDPTDDYDASPCVIETPMLDTGKPATEKAFTGIDAAVEGKWDVWLNPDPLNPGAWTYVAQVENSTYSLARIPYEARSTHIAIKMASVGSQAAKIGALVIHYDGKDAA